MRNWKNGWWLGMVLAGGLLLGAQAAQAETFAECAKGCTEDQAECKKVCEDKIKNPLGKQKCLEACDEVALEECLADCKEQHRR